MYKPRRVIQQLPKPLNDLKPVKIYTDGACRNNPGVGGWGAVLIYGDKIKEICGGVKQTTNNRMELTAVIEALKSLKEKCDVTIYSDSNYVIQAFNLGWVMNWKRNNWKSGMSEIKNADLWVELYNLSLGHEMTWQWVKGHSGNKWNERADSLANAGINKI